MKYIIEVSYVHVLWLLWSYPPISYDPDNRYRPRFFDQVGHQTTYAFIGNKHFLLNHVIFRPTKIMSRSDKTKIGHIFRKQNTLKVEVFKKKSLVKVDLIVKYSSQKKKSERFPWFLMLKNDWKSKFCDLWGGCSWFW